MLRGLSLFLLHLLLSKRNIDLTITGRHGNPGIKSKDTNHDVDDVNDDDEM